MQKIVFFLFFSCLLPRCVGAQKLPKGMDKALAAQEKARKATEKVDYAKGKRKKTAASSLEYANYGSGNSNRLSSNRDILRRMNERINESMGQKKTSRPPSRKQPSDFEFGSAKKALNSEQKN